MYGYRTHQVGSSVDSAKSRPVWLLKLPKRRVLLPCIQNSSKLCFEPPMHALSLFKGPIESNLNFNGLTISLILSTQHCFSLSMTYILLGLSNERDYLHTTTYIPTLITFNNLLLFFNLNT